MPKVTRSALEIRVSESAGTKALPWVSFPEVSACGDGWFLDSAWNELSSNDPPLPQSTAAVEVRRIFMSDDGRAAVRQAGALLVSTQAPGRHVLLKPTYADDNSSGPRSGSIWLSPDFGGAALWDEYGASLSWGDDFLPAGLSSLIEHWQSFFEMFADTDIPTSDERPKALCWPAFNAWGKTLAWSLACCRGAGGNVFYEPPYEDLSSPCESSSWLDLDDLPEDPFLTGMLGFSSSRGIRPGGFELPSPDGGKSLGGPLHVAVRLGSTDDARDVLSAMPWLLDSLDGYGMSPLSAACARGAPETVSLLLDAGAVPSASGDFPDAHLLALAISVRRGRESAESILPLFARLPFCRDACGRLPFQVCPSSMSGRLLAAYERGVMADCSGAASADHKASPGRI